MPQRPCVGDTAALQRLADTNANIESINFPGNAKYLRDIVAVFSKRAKLQSLSFHDLASREEFDVAGVNDVRGLLR